MTRPRKIPARDSNPGPSALGADALTTRPTRRCTYASNPPKTVNPRDIAEEHRRRRMWSLSLLPEEVWISPSLWLRGASGQINPSLKNNLLTLSHLQCPKLPNFRFALSVYSTRYCPASVYECSHINNCVLTTVPQQKASQVKASMPECYIAVALDVWPGLLMSACSGTDPFLFHSQGKSEH